MADKTCLSLNLMLRDERFRKLQEWYPKTHPFTLKTRLERYRNEMMDADELVEDWYPDENFKAAFTSFMHLAERKAQLEKAKDSMKSGNRLGNINAVLSVYNRGQLADAIDCVVQDFIEVLDSQAENYKGRSLAYIVKQLGGFKGIMDALFKNYANATGESYYEAMVKDGMSDSTKAELKSYAERVALEHKTMAEYKEHLIARAAGRISELTGLKADFEGLLADWKTAADMEVNDDDDSQAKKEDGATKGASYVDVRMKRMSQTLSKEAKKIISGIQMLDENGMPVTTIFGRPRTMDYSQVAYPLLRVVETANPINFMDKLKEASAQYPWMMQLYDKLKGNTPKKWQMRAIIYTNFKKATNRYYTIYLKKGKYESGLVNSAAKGSTVVRHMVNNMIGGISLGSKYSIYDSAGTIKLLQDYKGIQSDLTVISQMLDGVETRENGKPVDEYGANTGKRESYYGMVGPEAMREFIRLHSDVIDRIVEYARGIGLDIYRDDIERAALADMPSSNQYNAKNRLSALVQGINAVYGQAASGKYEDADKLSTVISQASKYINFAIARALYDEVEDRALVNGKTIAARQGINLIHQIEDLLRNADNLSTEDFRKSLIENFGQYEGYTADAIIRQYNSLSDEEKKKVPLSRSLGLVGWIADLYDNPSNAKRFEVINMLNHLNVEYAKLNDGQRRLIPFLLWKNNDKGAYEIQIQADYEHCFEFCRFVGRDGLGFIKTSDEANAEQKKLYGSTRIPLYFEKDGEQMWNTHSPIVDAFVDEVMAELDRIESIEARSGVKHKELSTYETYGVQFNIFPAFNIDGFREKYYELETGSKRDDFLRKRICEELQKIVDEDTATFENSELKTNPFLDMFKDGKLTESARGDFQDFSLNNYYARLQMARLFGGGFGHFENITEFEKRSAFDHAPHDALYTEGMRQERHVVIIDDDVTASAFIEQETQFAESLYANGRITETERDAMIAAYGKIKSTDGQALVTMDAWVNTLKMMGKWNENIEGRALERVRKGTAKQSDFDTILNHFGDTQKLVGTGFQHIPAAPIEGQKPVKNPFFHKCSEIPLFSAEFAKYTPQAKATFNRGLVLAADRLKAKGIDVDVFLFKSGAKLGVTGLLYPAAKNADGSRTFKTAEQIASYLVDKISSDPDMYVQKMPMTGYGKAASLPQFEEDEKITTSVQSVNAAFTDIATGEKSMLEVNGELLDASECRDTYDNIEAAEIIDAYQDVSALIGDKKELERIFQTELASKSYSSEEVMYALSLLDNGEFAAHLFTPTFAKDIQNMLFSLISQRMTKKKARGAHIAEFTSVGLDVSSSTWDEEELPFEDQLGIQFEGEGDNLRCLGIEAGVPIYDSKFEIFADENGAIPAELLRSLVESGRIAPECLQCDANRTPADYTHSDVPIIIKWMSARVAGGKGARCKESEVMDGHDFDGDEAHFHFPELELIWDEKKLKALYAKALKSDVEDGTHILKEGGMTDDEFIAGIEKKDGKNRLTRALDKAGMREWRDAAKLDVVKYDFTKSPMEEGNTSAAARHNAKLALRRAVLTSPEGSRRLFTPGSNDESTIFAKALHIHKMLGANKISAERLYQICDEENIKGADFSDPIAAYKTLTKMTIGQMEMVFNKVNSNTNPYSYSYAVEAYKRVIGGAAMIDVFALYSGAAQMLQRADLYYKPFVTKKGFVWNVSLFGHRFNKLYDPDATQRINGKMFRLLPGLLLSRMVQSAVDNNKNPILGMLNQTQQLAPMMNLLCAAGLTEEQIHLIFNQPAIIELVSRMTRRDSKGMAQEAYSLIRYIDDNYREKGTPSYMLKTYQALDDIAATSENTYIKGSAFSFSDLNNADQDVKKLQCNLLRTFIHLDDTAEDLTEIVRVTRPGSSSGTVGPDIAQTAVKKDRLDTLRAKIASGKCHISNADALVAPLNDDVDDLPYELYENLKDRPVARVAALNSLMYDKVMEWTRQYFPQARRSWVGLAVKLAKRYEYRSLQEGVIRQIFNDMLTWKILANQSFIGDIEARRKELLEDFPKELRKLLNSVKTARSVIKKGGVPTDNIAASLIDNPFVNKLNVRRDRITFQPGGVVNVELRNQWSAGWAQLAESEYPEVREVATKLYEYNILTNGMRFGMYEFAHLAPMAVLQAVPALSDTLDDVLTSDFTAGDENTKNFVRQYYMNHWQDDKLVPLYDENELPNGFREYFGLRTIDTQSYENLADIPKTVSLKEIKNKFYIAVKTFDPSVNKKVTKLYRLTVNKDGSLAEPQEVAKLGKRGKHGQVSVHYNPNVSYRFFDINEEVKDVDYVPEDDGADFGYSESGDFSTKTLVNDNPFVLPGREKKAATKEEDPRGNPFLLEGRPVKGPKEMQNSIWSLGKLRKSAEEADAKNDIPESEEPIDYSAWAPENFEDEDERGIDTWEEEEETFEEQEFDEEEADETPTDENGGPLYYIAQREGNDVEVFTKPLKPWTVRQARRQRAYIKLRKNIERILESKGISIGVLDEMEARMDGLYGVTDFDKINVITEGMKELIRIREGVGGLIALPEEFGHLALAMLGERDVHVQRLLNVIEANPDVRKEAFEGNYDEYERLYKGEQRKLAIEAAGKLVSKALLREQEIQNSKVRTVLRYVIDKIKELLGRFGIRQFENAQFEAHEIAGELARELLSGRLVDAMDLKNITQTGQLYKKVKTDISENKDVVSNILKVEERRLKILDKRLAYMKNKGSDAAVQAAKKEIAALKDAIKKHKTEDAIISYFGYATDFLNATKQDMDKLTEGGYGANKVCKKLDIIRDTIDGFKLTIKHVNDAIDSGEIIPTKNLRQSIKEITQYCAELMTDADRIGMQYFQGTVRRFFGKDSLEVTVGPERGRKISIEEMTTTAPKDVSIFRRWVHSLANSNDLVLQAIDGIVRRAKQTARADSIMYQKRIDVAFSKLEKATGSRDQTFMFKYEIDKTTGKRVKTKNYISAKDAEKLPDAKREFYTTMMEIKKELDKMLPESLTSPLQIIMMRKLALEKARESKDVKEKGMYVWEAAKNMIMETGDIDFDHQEVEVSFRGNKVDRLPVLYCKKGKSESYDDMVDDVATSMMAYAAMANEYAQMNEIIGELENARYMASKRRVQQHSGKRQKRETVQDNDTVFYEPFTVEQARTRLQAMLEDYFCMHVYGHIRADEGTFGNTRISKGKTAQSLNALTSASQLGFNITQRIANLSVGEAQMVIQAVGGGLFKMKDIVNATGIYMKNTADRLLDTGKLESDNYLSLFIEKFDVRQDNGRSYKERKYYKSAIQKTFNTNLMYAGLTAGEDYLACTTAIALALNVKMINAEGKEDNLWNAYEVKYLDEANKMGAYLQMKEGWKFAEEGEQAELERKFMNLSAGVNFDLQGIYNLDDKSAMQQYAFGSLVMMYRKWMAPALKLRYGEAHYDPLRGTWEEGYYRTTIRYVWDSIMDIIKEGEGISASFQANWEKLTPYEKTNIERAMREFAILTGAVGTIAALEKIPPEENKEEKSLLSWTTSMLIYQLYRLRNELGAQAPTPLLVQEGMKILETPFASLSLVKNALEVWKLFLPSSYTTTVKSGAYKGHSKAYQTFWNMPVLSMRKQFNHFIDPSPMINYYANSVL